MTTKDNLAVPDQLEYLEHDNLRLLETAFEELEERLQQIAHEIEQTQARLPILLLPLRARLAQPSKPQSPEVPSREKSTDELLRSIDQLTVPVLGLGLPGLAKVAAKLAMLLQTLTLQIQVTRLQEDYQDSVNQKQKGG